MCCERASKPLQSLGLLVVNKTVPVAELRHVPVAIRERISKTRSQKNSGLPTDVWKCGITGGAEPGVRHERFGLCVGNDSANNPI